VNFTTEPHEPIDFWVKFLYNNHVSFLINEVNDQKLTETGLPIALW